MAEHIKKLRDACMQRGAKGIVGIGRLFRIMDDDGSRNINFPEFKKGIDEYHLGFSKEEIQHMFSAFDKDRSGSISYNEFILALRPSMSKRRVDVINKAFDKMDKTKDGTITLTDMRGVYVATKHPKYLSGEWTEDQVFRQVLDVFDTPGQGDGIVTKDEFTNYYAGVSASIDDDGYFETMMHSAWKL